MQLLDRTTVVEQLALPSPSHDTADPGGAGRVNDPGHHLVARPGNGVAERYHVEMQRPPGGIARTRGSTVFGPGWKPS